MTKKDKYPKVVPVIVKWVDSTAIPGWRDYKKSDMHCTSIGHLIKEGKDRVVICMNCSHHGNGDYMEIPTLAIKSIKKLKE